MDEKYIACTISTQVVLEYNFYVAKIMKGDTCGLASLILSLMYQSLFDIYMDKKLMSQKDNVKNSLSLGCTGFIPRRKKLRRALFPAFGYMKFQEILIEEAIFIYSKLSIRCISPIRIAGTLC